MIRDYRPEDLALLLPLWLESTTRSHPFINPTYWQESEPLVRDQYIPNSETWVYEVEGAIVGFISVMEQRFVGALFVHHRWHGKGVGVALMTHVQQRFPVLSLEVYEQNLRACAFYQKLGFSPVKRTFPAETNVPAQIMQWEKTA
ncbi:N-acetyltransferase [Symbiopectobacterium sp. RP]|uniref:N-acetyltransferase n=1 Tax=Symbiopectobacterium sp. RP TaxID=3248553 RepID=UPI003D278B59